MIWSGGCVVQFSLILLPRINRQNETIRNATKTVAETEEVAINITSELNRNREKIESTRDKVSITSIFLCK